MTDEINRTLGEIKGTLIEFKESTHHRFNEMHDLSLITQEKANNAHDLAKEAIETAQDSKSYSESIIQRAGVLAGIVSSIILGLAWVFEHIPKAIAMVFNH